MSHHLGSKIDGTGEKNETSHVEIKIAVNPGRGIEIGHHPFKKLQG